MPIDVHDQFNQPVAPTAAGHLTNKKYVDDKLALKANLASPTFSGTPKAPTAARGTNTTQLATTAFVQTAVAAGNTEHTHEISDVNNLQASLNSKANLASPTLTGTPKSTTPATTDNSARIATTAFVKASVSASGAGFPAPQTAAGVGQWRGFSGNLLPAGGTWAYFVFNHRIASSDGSLYSLYHVGVEAGGTKIGEALYDGFCWRIA